MRDELVSQLLSSGANERLASLGFITTGRLTDQDAHWIFRADTHHGTVRLTVMGKGARPTARAPLPWISAPRFRLPGK